MGRAARACPRCAGVIFEYPGIAASRDCRLEGVRDVIRDCTPPALFAVFTGTPQPPPIGWAPVGIPQPGWGGFAGGFIAALGADAGAAGRKPGENRSGYFVVPLVAVDGNCVEAGGGAVDAGCAPPPPKFVSVLAPGLEAGAAGAGVAGPIPGGNGAAGATVGGDVVGAGAAGAGVPGARYSRNAPPAGGNALKLAGGVRCGAPGLPRASLRIPPNSSMRSAAKAS